VVREPVRVCRAKARADPRAMPRPPPPCFLRAADPARLLVRRGTRVRPLAPYQLREVLAFQRGDAYDDRWLRAAASGAPHFVGATGRRWDLVALDA
jgi:hypothetical protein